MSSDAALRSELEEIQMQMDQKTDASLESTRRMMQMANESVETGVHTMDMLDHQGEQLDRVEEGMDKINEDMREAERNLHQLDKCCGLCVCPWKRRGNFEKSDQFSKTWQKGDRGEGVRTDQPSGSLQHQSAAAPGQGPYIDRITNDAREDEMDENLREVSGLVNNMRFMAVDMGNEIEAQNQQLDRINSKADSNVLRVQSADKHARQLVK